MADDEAIALPERVAAKAAGVSLRRLRRWAEADLVVPGIQRRTGERGMVRLYRFDEAVALLVAAELRAQGFSGQELRRILGHLRRRGYRQPLTELRFAYVHRIGPDTKRHRELYFQHPDGTWEGSRRPDQIVIHEVLVDLRGIAARVRQATRRQPDAAGRVETRRATMGGKPVFAGTRVPVTTVVEWLRSGHTTEQVLDAYPNLTVEDVEAARGQLVA